MLLLYGLINVITYSVRSYLSKHILSSVDSLTYFSVNNILYAILGVFFILFGNLNFKSLTELDTKTMAFILVSPVIGTISVLVYYELVKLTEVSILNPILSVSTNIGIMIMGIVLFNESFTWNKVIGTLLASSGIYFLVKK